MIGRGEAAAIALAKERSGILASNNLRDIKHYVVHYQLLHTMTADIVHAVVEDGYLSISEADSLWTAMIAKRQKLPNATYTEYRQAKASR